MAKRQMKVKIIFKTYDSWIGSYWKWKDGINILYIFIIPWLGIRLEHKSKDPYATRFSVFRVYEFIYRHIVPPILWVLIMTLWITIALLILNPN